MSRKMARERVTVSAPRIPSAELHNRFSAPSSSRTLLVMRLATKATTSSGLAIFREPDTFSKLNRQCSEQLGMGKVSQQMGDDELFYFC
jgi:hypothetical protein